MKKALKIGAVIFGMHCAFNLGCAYGLADPIVEALLDERYDLADYNSRRIGKMCESFPLVEDAINDIAMYETNFILKRKKKNRRVNYTKKK